MNATFNGYSNRATFVAALWLQNNAELFNDLNSRIFGSEDEDKPGIIQDFLYELWMIQEPSDMLIQMIDEVGFLSEVDCVEIAEVF